MQWLRAYDRALAKFPMTTKTVTSAVLFGAGDYMSQKLEARQAAPGTAKPFDAARTARMVAWGATFGVLAHGWYSVVVERVVTAKGYTGVALKVLGDQLIWTPPLNLLFFTFSGTLEHHDPAKAFANGQGKLWELLKVNWGVWFPVQTLNFTLVPPQYRVLFVNSVALFWSAYLSSMAADASAAAPTAVAPVVPEPLGAEEDRP